MPCYSRITTKMNNADNLAAALAALGWIVTKDALNVYAEKGNDSLSFTRYDKMSAFNVSGDTEHLKDVGKKYAEVGVRAWASRNRFTVTDFDSKTMTLVNRRAF